MPSNNFYQLRANRRDTPAHRAAVERVIAKHELNALTDKVETDLALLGVHETFERRVHAACAAAIKRNHKARTSNNPDLAAFKICEEIHIASGVAPERIQSLRELAKRQNECTKRSRNKTKRASRGGFRTVSGLNHGRKPRTGDAFQTKWRGDTRLI